MSVPVRNPNNLVISVSMSRSLLGEIDQRAKSVGLSRSQYLCQLAREDLVAKGDLTIRETPNSTGLTPAQAKVVAIVKKYPGLKRAK